MSKVEIFVLTIQIFGPCGIRTREGCYTHIRVSTFSSAFVILDGNLNFDKSRAECADPNNVYNNPGQAGSLPTKLASRLYYIM